MTTPDGRDARSGETFDAADPSVDAAASSSQTQRMPHTPGSGEPSATEQAPRTDEQDDAAKDADQPE